MASFLKGAEHAVRALVSQKKKRYQDDGFDLDLSYITDRIIAMGFPSAGREASYRNPLPEVQRFFNTRHGDGHYKIYNLCNERVYESPDVFPHTERFPFNDHNTSPFHLLQSLCKSIDAWLAADPKNVVGIHCKAGKGRTGLAVAAYLVHSGVCPTADEAIAKFAAERTSDGKGITIPSQLRYVHYYEQHLKGHLVHTPTYQLVNVRLHTVPYFDLGGGCNPFFEIRYAKSIKKPDGTFEYKEVKIYDQKKWDKKPKFFKSGEPIVDLDCKEHNVVVHGDVKFLFYDYDDLKPCDKMFHFWINTKFIDDNHVRLTKSVLDKAIKDKKHKHFQSTFSIELFFERLSDDGKAFEELVAHKDEGAAMDTSTDEEDGDDA